MICGALQTLNEEAFEDVASNELGSGVAPGETLSQQLAPIREGSEFSTSMDSGLSVAAPGFSNSFIRRGSGVVGDGGAGFTGVNGNNLLFVNTNLETAGSELSHSPVHSTTVNIAALVGLDENDEGDLPQQSQAATHKDATVIVMSQFTQNFDDTSL